MNYKEMAVRAMNLIKTPFVLFGLGLVAVMVATEEFIGAILEDD